METPVTPQPAAPGPSGPEAMRQQLFDYVGALHRAYLGQAAHLAPGERAGLPLLAAGTAGTPVTVIVAAARQLHIVATTQAMPQPTGPEVSLSDTDAGVSWSVRFYDPSILPELSMAAAAGDDPGTVQRILGLHDAVYHLTVSLGGGLTGHHAQHAGVALANQHASAARDGAALRNAYRSRMDVVDELLRAQHLGMATAARLLALELLPSLQVSALNGSDKDIRQALIAAAKTSSSAVSLPPAHASTFPSAKVPSADTAEPTSGEPASSATQEVPQ